MEEITWGPIRQWIHSRHAVVAETESEIAFTFAVDGWHRHMVVTRATCDGATWILISSPVVRAAHGLLADALRLISRSVVGSLAFVEQRLVVRHAEPIERITADTLEALCREISLGALQVDAMARKTSSSRPVFQHFAD